MSYLYISMTILLTVYGQIIVKWKVMEAGAMPEPIMDKLIFLFSILLNPWMLSVIPATLIAGLCWMAAMTKLDLSHAYPFVGLTFVLVAACSAVFFHEPLSLIKVAGLILIVAGIIVSSQG